VTGVQTCALPISLQFVKGVRTKAASILGIAPKTLRDKIDRYSLNDLFPVGSEAGSEDDRKEDETAEAAKS
jgi:hypothetical protein